MQDLPVQSIARVLRLVAAGARAKSGRIALRKKLNVVKRTPSRRPCSLGMSLPEHEIGPEARPPRRPRNRVGQGARKVPRQFPLIIRISNRSHFSAVPCLSPISAAAGITRHRRAKPTRVVLQRRRRSVHSVAPRSESHALKSSGLTLEPRCSGKQSVEQGGNHGRRPESRNSNP
jgi:hypothetical protein